MKYKLYLFSSPIKIRILAAPSILGLGEYRNLYDLAIYIEI